jgi:hypothetical protein
MAGLREPVVPAVVSAAGRDFRRAPPRRAISLSFGPAFPPDVLQAFEEQVESTGYAFKKTVTDVSKKV